LSQSLKLLTSRYRRWEWWIGKSNANGEFSKLADGMVTADSRFTAQEEGNCLRIIVSV